MKQQGMVTLLMSMLLLAVIALIGAASLLSSNTMLRLTGNQADRQQSLSGGDAAIKAAEALLDSKMRSARSDEAVSGLFNKPMESLYLRNDATPQWNPWPGSQCGLSESSSGSGGCVLQAPSTDKVCWAKSGAKSGAKSCVSKVYFASRSSQFFIVYEGQNTDSTGQMVGAGGGKATVAQTHWFTIYVTTPGVRPNTMVVLSAFRSKLLTPS
ncbi:MAG: hypothetical protein ACK5NY_06310 [Burkholderiaceae bacterium]